MKKNIKKGTSSPFVKEKSIELIHDGGWHLNNLFKKEISIFKTFSDFDNRTSVRIFVEKIIN